MKKSRLHFRCLIFSLYGVNEALNRMVQGEVRHHNVFCLMGGEHGKEALSTKKKKEKEDPWLPEADEE